MGFSKKQHLQQNIDALRIAFKLEKEKRQATVGERLLMMQYSGFGGLKFVLNPICCLFCSGMLITPDMMLRCIIHRFKILVQPFVPITLSNLYSIASSFICGADAFAVVKMGYILA